jgi:hypothetical protein
MAYTTSNLVKTVFGDQRVFALRVTADAATGAVATGLSHINTASLLPQSLSTAAVKFSINENCSGVAALGTIGVSGAASGDEFILTVFGK